MTNTEKSSLLKTWSAVAVIIGCLAGASGFGGGIAWKEAQLQNLDDRTTKLESATAKIKSVVGKLEDVDIRREAEVSRLDEKITRMETKVDLVFDKQSQILDAITDLGRP